MIPEGRAHISLGRTLINHLTTALVQITWVSRIIYSFIQQILTDNYVILDIANSMVSKQVSLYLLSIYYGILFFPSKMFLVCEQPMKEGSPCHVTGYSSPCNFCFCVQQPLLSIVFCDETHLMCSPPVCLQIGAKSLLSTHRYLDSLPLAIHSLMVLWY